jgi:hypothetical protein
MANPEQLKILNEGVEAWNAWRREHSTEQIDLSGANLSGAVLRHAHLSGVYLNGANFSNADLSGAELCLADLIRANLIGANLIGADLTRADLSGADLRCAEIFDVNLSGAKLNETNLSMVEVGVTIFSDVDLSEVIGLLHVIHLSPSTIGIDTLYKSQGKIPDKFLRDAGVPEDVIQHLLPLIRSGPPLQWHSCFISYSTKDEEFARRLHERMRAANMRVWFAPEDLKGGKKLHEQLFEAIQQNDRLLLVLSDYSILSDWVMTEIRKALEVEKKENRRKLFPIRLTDFETLREWKCFDADIGKDLAKEVREYFIPDFSNWKDHDAFEAAFARLQKDLKDESKRHSKPK